MTTLTMVPDGAGVGRVRSGHRFIRSPRPPSYTLDYSEWDLDESQKCIIHIESNALLDVDPAVVEPPDDPGGPADLGETDEVATVNVEFSGDDAEGGADAITYPDALPVNPGDPDPAEAPSEAYVQQANRRVWIKRVSQVFPAPDLDDRGRPVDWEPTSEQVANWGRFRLVVRGRDMTYYRGVPVVFNSFTINEPFGDGTGSFTFPQITPFEDHDEHLPKYARVRVQRVRPNGTRKNLWHGMIMDYNSESGQADNGLTIECVGAFYELDTMLRQPTFNDPVNDVSNHINTTVNQRILLGYSNLAYMPHVYTGFRKRNRGYFERIASQYIQDMLGVLHEPDGDQWTVSCENRKPRLHRKNTTTVHWTIRNGQPGVSHSLSQDLEVANVIYGEGVDSNSCHWRNTKYPSLRPDGAPIWPGTFFNIGSSGDSVLLWETEMSRNGWGVTVDGSYSAHDKGVCEDFQYQAGIQVDGIVGPQTWAATFEPGQNQGSLEARIMPLWYIKEAEVARYNAQGAVLGKNPDRNPNMQRIEQFINYGTPISKSVGVTSARRQIQHEWNNKGWFGTITLAADPNEGSRFGMRAGQNIRLRSYRGRAWLFHISQVAVDPENLTVTLTVDTKFRDLKTLAELRIRNYEAKQDPAARVTIGRRTSYEVEDRFPVWDCESGAGIVPRHGVYGGLWNVLAIPAGKFGQISAVGFNATQSAINGAVAATPFAVAIFDRPITANQIVALGGGDPRSAEFWENETLDEKGLLVAWGGEGQMGGYYPGSESDGDPLTGRLVDKSSWYFQSTEPPWLFVAIWSRDTCYIGGRLYPGVSGDGSFPNVTH